MKRVLTFLLLLFYTVSSVGASVSTHYCMGKIRKCQCATPKTEKKDHCCKDTVKYVKSQEDHSLQLAVVVKKHLNFASDICKTNFASSSYVYTSQHSFVKQFLCSATAPPIYKLLCNFRI